jgi:hypothetical protein
MVAMLFYESQPAPAGFFDNLSSVNGGKAHLSGVSHKLYNEPFNAFCSALAGAKPNTGSG